jgi:hypothetical protein
VHYQITNNLKKVLMTGSTKLDNECFITNGETIINVADPLSTYMYAYKNEQPGMSSNKLFKSYGTTL